jgi:uncharacterized protein YndB with AHSA1/START domain
MVAMSSITIERPIAEVFSILTNVENSGRWFPADIEEHWTSAPPHGLGATRHAVIRNLGRVTETDAVATEYDPPRRAVMAITVPDATVTVALDFETVGNGTRVTETTSFEFHRLMRLAGPPFGWWYRRAWATGLGNLKRLMESGEL